MDSTFNNNSVNQDYGGAINFNGNENFIINNCSFDRNYNAVKHVYNVNRGGGAITSNANNVTIINSTFTNNFVDEVSASGFGGAIFILANGINNYIIDSIFENNTALFTGGAILSRAEDTSIINSTFNNNAAGYDAGAICIWGDNLKIYNSTFTSNNATHVGGAVLNSGVNTFIVDSIFESNSIEIHGGAIYSENSDTSIINCTFNNNTARSGGAIFADYFESNTLISLSTFNNNRAEESNGGAIVFDGDTLTLFNSTFTSNIAKTDGGAVSFSGTDILIANLSFINNSANFGGAMEFSGDGLEIHNSTFISNTANSWAGAFYAQGEDVTIVNSSFIDNAADYAGAIDVYMPYSLMTIISSRFDGNNASKGSAIFLDEDAELYIADTIFGKNQANSTNLTIDVGDLYHPLENVTINMSFKGGDNIANAIWNDNDDPDFVTVNNITYEVYISGTLFNKTTDTTDTHPVLGYAASNEGEYIWQDTLENAQLLNYKITDENNNVLLNGTGNMTDIAGSITCFLENPAIGVYKVYATHLNDAYYTSIDATKYFEVVNILNTTKTTNNTQINISGNVTYTITIKNTCVTAVSNVTVVENTPEGFALTNYSNDSWNTTDNLTFTYKDNLNPNETITLTLTFNARKEGNFTNTINVSSNITDQIEVKSNNVTVNNPVTPVHHPNMTVNKVTENNTVFVRDKAVFVINVTNSGDELLTNLFVIEDFDKELIFDNFTSIVGDWSLNIENDTYVFNLPSLRIGRSASFKVYFNTTKEGTFNNNVIVGFKTTVKANTTANINVNKIPINLTVENITTEPGKNITITINTLTEGNKIFNDNVTVKLPDNTNQTVKIINNTGNLTWTIPDNYAGKYNITVEYEGSETYESTMAMGVIIVIPKFPIEITVGNITCKPGDNITLPINLTTDNGIPFNGNVTVNLPDGTNQTIEIVNSTGSLNWTVPKGINGTFKVDVYFEGDESYLPSKGTGFIKVSLVPTNIIVDNITCKPGDNITIPINVTTTDNIPFNGNITVILPDGTNKTVGVLNGNGNINLIVPKNYNGTYTIFVLYDGDGYYLSSNSTGYVIVTPDTPKPTNHTVANKTINISSDNKITGNPLLVLFVALMILGVGIKRRN